METKINKNKSYEKIPTKKTLKAIKKCGKGKGKIYKNFKSYMDEIALA
ncbi:hypothetical protein [Campylobacter sp. LR291e]|nr:hypothetical protein [Campylobacter sp. LR291e]